MHEVADRFQIALERAATTGDWTTVYPCLAADVTWITPQRSLTGIEQVEHDLTWASPPEHLDLEFEVGEWTDLGDGRATVEVHETYRVKDSGDFAYERKRRIEVTIRDGEISRYEMKFVGYV
jgi:ketosteroid isomerase-like protein